jgi:3',5'-cyclic AMP phosphodiesterase CpdA
VPAKSGAVFAIGDLHVEHPENREFVSGIEPESDADWLVVCGDVADQPQGVEWALRLLRERFAEVIWVPGNHELLAHRDAPDGLRGERRYRHLVQLCRGLGVITPEDPYPVWDGAGGPVRIAPLFLLYDYSFGSNVGATREEALKRAYEAGVVCVDEFLLDPVPYPSRRIWCETRVRATVARLEEARPALPTVLVNHFPLLVESTRVLRHPEFAQWCGTVRTADWHRRFDATAVVYGHLHVPRTTWHEGVRFEEVSLGYPRERRGFFSRSRALRRILPESRRA